MLTLLLRSLRSRARRHVEQWVGRIQREKKAGGRGGKKGKGAAPAVAEFDDFDEILSEDKSKTKAVDVQGLLTRFRQLEQQVAALDKREKLTKQQKKDKKVMVAEMAALQAQSEKLGASDRVALGLVVRKDEAKTHLERARMDEAEAKQEAELLAQYADSSDDEFDEKMESEAEFPSVLYEILDKFVVKMKAPRELADKIFRSTQGDFALLDCYYPWLHKACFLPLTGFDYDPPDVCLKTHDTAVKALACPKCTDLMCAVVFNKSFTVSPLSTDISPITKRIAKNMDALLKAVYEDDARLPK